jgi:hypothetical protein
MKKFYKDDKKISHAEFEGWLAMELNSAPQREIACGLKWLQNGDIWHGLQIKFDINKKTN